MMVSTITKIKWKGEFSEGFKIEQGVRQGGTLECRPVQNIRKSFTSAL
jgi:hypothetical protein